MPDLCALTDRVIVIAIFLLVTYNVVVGMLSGGDATISVRLQHHMARFPIIAMLIGAMAAHWCWPVRGIRD